MVSLFSARRFEARSASSSSSASASSSSSSRSLFVGLLLAVVRVGALHVVPPNHGDHNVLRSPSARRVGATRVGAAAAAAVDAVVVGGGPAGLLSAIMLARERPEQRVRVFDRLSVPPSPTDEDVWSDVAKFYLIGLGSRGQKALQRFGVWDEVEAVCTAVVGRKDWSPEADSEEGVENIYTDRPYTTQVLPRDKLVGVLHKHVQENYPDQIEIMYDHEVTPLDFNCDNGSTVCLSVSKCKKVEESSREVRINPSSVATDPTQSVQVDECDIEDSYVMKTNFLIAADGTGRTVANQMEENDKVARKQLSVIGKVFSGKPFKVTRYEDDNQRVYKTVPMKLPADWRPDLNYSARTKDGRVTFDALPADADGNYCGVLLLRKDDELAKPNSDPQKLRELLDDALPQFSCLIEDEMLRTIAKKPPSFLPGFRYAGPRLHQNDRTVILGDCAHTVKPYFGLGANSALEDVSVLSDILDANEDIANVVRRFSTKRANESKALVKISRELDRPGTLGFFTFILPLILDSIFHKIAPKVFAPNIIAMLQRDGVDFCGVRRRKRMDRVLQVACVGSVLTGFSMATKRLVKFVASLSGKSITTLAGITTAVAALFLAFQKAKFFLNPDLAPADVLAQTKSSILDNESFIYDKSGKKQS